ncbi:hypothetical protein [Fimbriiglobus ruber]|uniref:hypothetical protein n=1 Tax=Fimbriiglobus ruber TaxID=1908690 RepID=UPI00117B1F83|nr:hypothetical protein [Fimbriiglobus ruber]
MATNIEHPTNSQYISISASSDGKYIFAVRITDKSRIDIISISTSRGSEATVSYGFEIPADSREMLDKCDFDADKKRIVVCSHTGERRSIIIRDCVDSKTYSLTQEKPGSTSCIKLDDRENILYFGSDDGNIYKWQFQKTNNALQTLKFANRTVSSIAIDSAKTIAAASFDRGSVNAILVDARGETNNIRIISDPRGAQTISLHPNRREFAIIGEDCILIYDIEKLRNTR